VANPLVEFYSGRAPDHAGRFVGQIQQWPDERLEAVHDFIQWLFPLAEPSPVNPLAPVLDRETIEAFSTQPELRRSPRLSFLRMLRFYGLEVRSGKPLRVQPAANFDQRGANWLHPGNHNHLRITRILKSMALLGLREEAGALLECLETIYSQHPGKISAVSLRFWRAAIGPAGT
jgi:Opioid growth factor receptor (OGFr) conserved region